MRFELLDFTHPLPVWNVALDESLLLEREQLGGYALLRLWEPATPFVVMGRSSRYNTEVNVPACESDDVPFFRRCSGGASIVTGPGCLMYAVLIPFASRPELRALEVAHQFVMSKIQQAVTRLEFEVSMQGTCDLTFRNQKFSGNAMRVTRDWLLYHGTILCSMNLKWISKYLGSPDRQPDYRKQRTHDEFVTQLPCTTQEVKSALIEVWQADSRIEEFPESRTQELVASRYSLDSWNRKR